MNRVVRISEILLGLLFVAAAVLKALDMDAFAIQVRLYGVVHELHLVRLAAWGSLAAESLLGIAMLAGIRLRGITIALTVAMLIGFTGLIAYAWKYQGLSDCGCFGKYVQMSPGVSIAKNVVMLVLALIAGIGARRAKLDQIAGNWFLNPSYSAQAVVTVICAVLVIAATQVAPVTPTNARIRGTSGSGTDPNAAPFAQFKFDFEGRPYDLRHGEFIVAMLSASCDHCKAAVPALNEYTINPDLPTLVALVHSDTGTPDGNKDELERFRQETRPQFPNILITELSDDRLLFYSFVGKAPPRLYAIRDGKEIKHWDDLTPPSADLVLEAFKAPAPTTPAS